MVVLSDLRASAACVAAVDLASATRPLSNVSFSLMSFSDESTSEAAPLADVSAGCWRRSMSAAMALRAASASVHA